VATADRGGAGRRVDFRENLLGRRRVEPRAHASLRAGVRHVVVGRLTEPSLSPSAELFVALNGPRCADVPLRNYSLTLGVPSIALSDSLSVVLFPPFFPRDGSSSSRSFFTAPEVPHTATVI